MNEQSQGDTIVNPVDTTVTVSRSVSQPIKQFWKLLVTREGAEALLGPGGELGDKGDSWHAADGTYGVIRSYHPLEQIRFSWHAAEEAPTTIVEKCRPWSFSGRSNAEEAVPCAWFMCETCTDAQKRGRAAA